MTPAPDGAARLCRPGDTPSGRTAPRRQTAGREARALIDSR
ncbi:MAG TPA: hypothetical protein PKY22_06365 [Accumulibacter sp.]|nr:hypothetical protein [Accumulibacter sp.]